MSVLESPTLVLNRGWQAIRIERVRDSLPKVFSGTAKLIDHSDYACYDWDEWVEIFGWDIDKTVDVPCITTPSCKIRVPEVVVLTNYNKMPEQKVRLTRRNLFVRDAFRCQYTGKKVTMRTGTIDHVFPKSRGGKTVWENVVLASFDANVKKGGRTPKEAGLHLVREPQRPKWHPLFTKWLERHPESWNKFINTDKWNEIGYWDVELQD